MTEKETLMDGLEKIDPFFAKIAKYDNEQKKQSKEDEMTGRNVNRILDEKWNIKIQIGTDFLVELFTFLGEMEYNAILRLTNKEVKIYIRDPSGTHLCYVIINKTEMSEYINTDITNQDVTNTQESEPETVIYTDFDILEETILNNKYPTDIYFDTKDKNTMYIVNGKVIESRRLKSLDNQDPTSTTYVSFYEKLMRWLKSEESFIMNVSYVSFSNVLKFIERKNTKKDKTVSKILEVNFRKNEIDFVIENELKSSSVQMYGDDITIPGTRDVSLQFTLGILTKMARLKFRNNAILHINENLPLIIETKFGAGKIYLYYLVALRESEERVNTNEQNNNEEQTNNEE